MIYYSLIYPFLSYGITVWGSANESTIKPLLVLQKTAVRIISKCNISNDYFRKPPSLPLFNKLNLLIIQDIFKLEITKFVYDSVNKINPPQFHSYFKLSNSPYNTKSSTQHKLFLPQIRTTNYGIKSIKFTGALTWNDLPFHIRSIQSRKSFIRRLKKQIIASYLSTQF